MNNQELYLIKTTNDIRSILNKHGLDKLEVENFGKSNRQLKLIIPFQERNHSISYPMHEQARNDLEKSGYKINLEQADKKKGLIYIIFTENKIV